MIILNTAKIMLLSVNKHYWLPKRKKKNSQEKGTRVMQSEELTPSLVKLTSGRTKKLAGKTLIEDNQQLHPQLEWLKIKNVDGEITEITKPFSIIGQRTSRGEKQIDLSLKGTE